MQPSGRGRVSAGILIAAACLTVASTPVVGAQAATSGFVQRQGTQLTLDGAPWHPIGWNNYRLTNTVGGFVCDRKRGVLTDAEMTALFAGFKNNTGANVVRTWFFQSYYAGNKANPWAAFDRVLSAASAAGVLVIPVLTNNYAPCEQKPTAQKTTSFYAGGYESAAGTGNGYALSYLDYARLVAQHYADSTTIAFWQLVNEIDPLGCTSANQSAVATAIHDFGDTVATAIKSVDANHLVSLGTQGSGQCGTSGTYYSQVHAASAIDMCEYHDYNEPNHALPTGNAANPVDSGNGLQTRLSQCAALGLPLIVGESGIEADVGPDGTSTGTVTAVTLAQRGRDFGAKMQAALSAGAAGYLIWEGIPEASDSPANTGDGGYGVGPGDPTQSVMLGVVGADGAAAGTLPESLHVPLLPLAAAGGVLSAWMWGRRRRPPLHASQSPARPWGGSVRPD